MVLQTIHSMNVDLLMQIDHQDLNSSKIPQNNYLVIITRFTVSLLPELPVIRKLVDLTSCMPF